jgi:sporulation protein YlmC with PRC-barrel domain
MRELRVELLVGRKVVDRKGRKVGRIEEIVAEYRGTELVVTEVHVGRRGMAERFSLRAQVRDKTPTKLRWSDLDLSDPDHPRLTKSIEEL